MPGRVLDSVLGTDMPAAIRRDVGLLTTARLAANACYRFAPPFLATIARGTDVSLEDIGIALAVAEVAGLLSPLTARLVDRLTRRRALVVGLVGVAAGTVLAAASTGLVVFAVALVVLSQSKVLFDLGLGSWVTDHVSYEQRSRVVGVTETSWAFGLLIGVSVMGVVTGIGGWRAGYLAGAIAVLVLAVAVRARLPVDDVAPMRPQAEPSVFDESAESTESTESTGASGRAEPAPPGQRARIALVVGAATALMAASQSVFVTFGSWLEDSFDFSATALAAVVFGLGVGELVASLTSARRTDIWGKERSVAGGAVLMVPGALLLALFHEHLSVGLIGLAVAIACFEFAIVSSIAIGLSLVPSSPARGLGLTLAGGTVGRAVVAVPATRLYEGVGVAGPALLTAGFAALTAMLISASARFGQPATR